MNLYVYGSHDASITIEKDGQIFVYEIERYNNKRYSALTNYYSCLNYLSDDELNDLIDLIKVDTGVDKLNVCYYNQIFDREFKVLKEKFQIESFISFDHHKSHAATSYYQSNFNDAFIISYDGGGQNADGTVSYFTVWRGVENEIHKIKDVSFDLGTPYMLVGNVISDIKKNPNNVIQLSNSGKLMGYSSYGKVRHDWVNSFVDFYKSQDFSVFKQIGFDLKDNSLSGELAMDFSATSQFVFEKLFFQIFDSLNIPIKSNICLGGGCALNILINQKLVELGYNVYVPPNPNDCGLSLGALLSFNKIKYKDLTYRGFELIDKNLNIKNYKSVTNSDIADLLFKDCKILGYLKDRSECGPRALGNRSIICYPDQVGLKNKLNKEIKFREWFRPFGAIIRLEDLDLIVENGVESQYMSFCPTLRSEYRFESITHIDNTCRIQTITKEQHPSLYDILTNIENLGGHPILLNTSFNIKGRPILTRLSDAVICLTNSSLDGFIYKNKLYTN